MFYLLKDLRKFSRRTMRIILTVFVLYRYHYYYYFIFLSLLLLVISNKTLVACIFNFLMFFHFATRFPWNIMELSIVNCILLKSFIEKRKRKNIVNLIINHTIVICVVPNERIVISDALNRVFCT